MINTVPKKFLKVKQYIRYTHSFTQLFIHKEQMSTICHALFQILSILQRKTKRVLSPSYEEDIKIDKQTIIQTRGVTEIIEQEKRGMVRMASLKE